MNIKELIKKHYQPFLAGALLLVGLIVLGIIQLVDSGVSQAERLKERGDRYYATHDVDSAVRHYEWALEADPQFEDVYLLLFDIYFTKFDDKDRALELITRGLENVGGEKMTELYDKATDYPVVFRNGHNFNNHVRAKLGNTVTTIMRSDLDTITELRLTFIEPYATFYFSDLHHFRNLEKLTLNVHLGYSMSDISELTKLKELELRGTSAYVGAGDNRRTVNLIPISELVNLERLVMTNCFLKDLTPLENLKNLKHLDISVDQYRYDYNYDITGFSVVKNLPALEYFNFKGNIIPAAAVNNRSDTAHIKRVFGYPTRLPVDENDYYIDVTKEFGQDITGIINAIENYDGYVLNSDLGKVEMLYFSGEYGDLEFLKRFTNLKTLLCGDITVHEISALWEITTLTSLTLSNVHTRDSDGRRVVISSLAGIEKLTSLEHLEINYLDNTTDYSPLAGLTNLKSIYIFSNNGGGSNAPKPLDLSWLAKLTNLESLGIGVCSIEDISPLRNLTGLQSLYLHNNNISDLSLLAGLKSLQILNLNGNNITDVSSLAGLTNLSELNLTYNKITDVRPLANLTKLTRQKHEWYDDYYDEYYEWFENVLHLWGNPITDFSSIRHLVDDVYDNYDYNDQSAWWGGGY